jgi:hypothetical protein
MLCSLTKHYLSRDYINGMYGVIGRGTVGAGRALFLAGKCVTGVNGRSSGRATYRSGP